jgi:hypothetical protein
VKQKPPRPNDSCLLVLGANRVTNDGRWEIRLPAMFRAAYACEPDLMRAVRKTAVREREYWGAEKKAARDNQDAARWAKEQERLWLQRERAASLLVGWTAGSAPEQLETYYWPTEIAPALEWAISEVSP